MARVAYVTDIEGQWVRLAGFVERNPYVCWSARGDLDVAADAIFVFGGDAVDRGDAGRRVVATLLAAKRRQPDRVVLLCGNRDLNKLRLLDELTGSRAARGDRLRTLLDLLGAPHAFEHRAAELRATGDACDPDAVVESFLADLAPDGPLTSYLAAARLAFRHGETLFVHGAVTDESLGWVPGCSRRLDDVDEWITALNGFYEHHIAAVRARARCSDGRGAWAPLIRYQGPLPGTRLNQASVVYGRPLDASCNPILPSPDVIARLRRHGIHRLVVGHSANGDCPGVIRDGDGFEVILGDHSRGGAWGSQVLLDENPRILGRTRLPGGQLAEVATELSSGPPLGTRLGGYLVKGRLERGDYLLYRCSADYRVEHSTARGEDLCPS